MSLKSRVGRLSLGADYLPTLVVETVRQKAKKTGEKSAWGLSRQIDMSLFPPPHGLFSFL